MLHSFYNSVNSPSISLYHVSAFMRVPSTYSVLTHLGMVLHFSSSYTHSERVIQEPALALAAEFLPAHMITEYSPVLFILA